MICVLHTKSPLLEPPALEVQQRIDRMSGTVTFGSDLSLLDLQTQLKQYQEENKRLRAELQELKNSAVEVTLQHPSACLVPCNPYMPTHELNKKQVERYSRQLLLSSFGVQAQSKLCKASVLIVGCGGLGSPAAVYLAAAGVGRLGLLDRDAVEITNLHRQIAHTEARVGQHKAQSSATCVQALNSSITVDAHLCGITASNALPLVAQYDVVLDCSDNPATRYLVSDACVVAQRPLVSGAAVGTDGQLTVYCHGEDGPCYRCLFPESPPPATCSRCSDAGVLGPVPGVIGVLQALEAIKLVTGVGEPLSRRMLVYDALSTRFHTVKLRPKVPNCAACSHGASITAESLPSLDYEQFTGQPATDGPPVPLHMLDPSQRITATEMQSRLAAANERAGADGSAPLVLLDVRPATQFSIMSLPGAVNVPITELDERMDEVKRMCMGGGGLQPEVLVVCRRGNDSQRVVHRLQQHGISWARDVVGGYTAWAAELDPSMPVL